MYIGFNVKTMPNSMRTLIFLSLLSGLIILVGPSYAQTLQIGGKIGGSTVVPIDPSSATIQPGGTAGVFADYRAKKYRFGLRVEMNYQNRNSLASEQVNVPVLAELGLDKKGIVRLHAGPYLGVSTDDQQAIEGNKLRIRWGFSTGLDLNIPLSRKLILISESRLSQDLSGQETHTKSHYVPAKSLHLSLSFGLAYRIKRWKEKRR